MSPFAKMLTELRNQRNLRQGLLAEQVGYDQSYVSALETGQKGPPTPEFVERLAAALKLPESERVALLDSAKASQRVVTLENTASEELFWLLDDLRKRLPSLSNRQIRLLREIMRLQDPTATKSPD